jgi:hypothetical protein
MLYNSLSSLSLNPFLGVAAASFLLRPHRTYKQHLRLSRCEAKTLHHSHQSSLFSLSYSFFLDSIWQHFPLALSIDSLSSSSLQCRFLFLFWYFLYKLGAYILWHCISNWSPALYIPAAGALYTAERTHRSWTPYPFFDCIYRDVCYCCCCVCFAREKWEWRWWDV